ncbi:MAG: glutaredoxin 3 [Alphaproteobacteria bacterium]|nr:glutaredoxin 3 [Alphaproteobacteria bacterium]
MRKVIIYSSMFCPYCDRAKGLLSHKEVDFDEINVDSTPGARQEMTQRARGGYTVPQIFIGDRHIGGCDELYALEAAGELDSLLAG